MVRIKAETGDHCKLLMVLWHDGVFYKYIDWPAQQHVSLKKI